MSRRLQIGGRLDRYVARLFAASYATAFLVVVGLFLIVDMAAHLDDYLEPRTDGLPQGAAVLRYYLLQLPFLYLQVSPFVTLLAGLFVGVRMAQTSEIVAALNAGISGRRLFAPLFAGGIVCALAMFALREWATDSLGRRRDALHDRLAEGRLEPVFEDFTVRDPEGSMLLVKRYRPGAEDGGTGAPTIEGLSRPRVGAGSRSSQLSAERAEWSRERGLWILSGARLVESGEARKKESTLDGPYDLGVTPSDVLLSWKGHEDPLDRSFSECRRLLEREPHNAPYRTLYHYHLSFPLAGLVLLACGLPFVMGQERGRSFERLAVGLGLCVAYFGLDFVTRTLGMAGQIGPILASWLPVLFFGSVGVVLFGSMRS